MSGTAGCDGTTRDGAGRGACEAWAFRMVMPRVVSCHALRRRGRSAASPVAGHAQRFPHITRLSTQLAEVTDEQIFLARVEALITAIEKRVETLRQA